MSINSGILKNMISVNKTNSRLLQGTPEQRTDMEINDRIMRGLRDEDKDRLIPYYAELRAIILDFFNNHNYPRCPYDNYAHILKIICPRPNLFFSMVVQNDGAINRWMNKTGEWFKFNESEVLKELENLNNNAPSKDNSKPDYNIFDGKVV
jgi:hypothetical protein